MLFKNLCNWIINSMIMQGASEMLAYGTAVKLK